MPRRRPVVQQPAAGRIAPAARPPAPPPGRPVPAPPPGHASPSRSRAPVARCRARSSSPRAFAQGRIQRPSGSSSSSSGGRFTRLRTSATRCRWPPESCAGLRASKPCSPTRASAGDPPGDLRPRHPFAPQPIGDVVEHAQMREQRVALEHHADRPQMRRQRADVAPLQQHAAGLRRLEPRDDPQQGGLAGPAAAEKCHEFPRRHVQAQSVQCQRCAEALRHPLDAQQGLVGPGDRRAARPGGLDRCRQDSSGPDGRRAARPGGLDRCRQDSSGPDGGRAAGPGGLDRCRQNVSAPPGSGSTAGCGRVPRPGSACRGRRRGPAPPRSDRHSGRPAPPAPPAPGWPAPRSGSAPGW